MKTRNPTRKILILFVGIATLGSSLVIASNENHYTVSFFYKHFITSPAYEHMAEYATQQNPAVVKSALNRFNTKVDQFQTILTDSRIKSERFRKALLRSLVREGRYIVNVQARKGQLSIADRDDLRQKLLALEGDVKNNNTITMQTKLMAAKAAAAAKF